MPAAGDRGRLILGTSGFAYKHWRGSFYPKGTAESHWLESYAERFSALELNVSFYRLPKRETFVDWAARTPEDFSFVVKGSRTITHYRRLRDSEDAVSSLVSAASALGPKLSCMLWQLPPHSGPDVHVLDAFCALLAECGSELAPGVRLRHAFEFRDPRWFAEEVLDVLREYRHALVLADPPRENEPRLLTADFTYLRFHHGPRQNGAYEKAELRPYARRASDWLIDGIDVYAFFNNDPGGWAPKNAQTFGAMVTSQV
jgi:uncharacterized protein YecE (DUF72 family)